jgi:hypothetical protein
MSTLLLLGATMPIDPSARAALLRNSNIAGFSRAVFRANESLPEETTVTDNRNKVERPALAAATKQKDLLRLPATQWWRLTPATAFDAIALREMRAALSKINMLGEPRWKDAATGDAAASIHIALSMRRKKSAEARYDLAMTALAVCAADGNAAACLVMSHILRKIPGAGNAESRIATSWLVHAFSEALSRRADTACTEDEGAE